MRGRCAGAAVAAVGVDGLAAGAGCGAVRDDGARDSAAPPHPAAITSATRAAPIAVQTCVRTIRPCSHYGIQSRRDHVRDRSRAPRRAPTTAPARVSTPSAPPTPCGGSALDIWTDDPATRARSRTGWDGFAPSIRSRRSCNGCARSRRRSATEGYERVLLMGMGGSSLAPEVLRAVIGDGAGVSALRHAGFGEPRRRARGFRPSGTHAAHRRQQVGHDDRAERRSPPRRSASPRRAAAVGRKRRGDHRSRHRPLPRRLSRDGVPRRLRQSARHRRALLRPVALRHGAGRADGRRPRRAWWRRRAPWQSSAVIAAPRATPAWRSAP